MNIKLVGAALLIITTFAVHAQEKKADTVIVSLAKTSKVVFTIQDRSDLEILKHYNFQDLFEDILKKLEASDSTKLDSTSAPLANAEKEEDWGSTNSDDNEGDNDSEDENDEEWKNKSEHRRGKIGRTWQSTNMDFGINNYLSKGQFPEGSEPFSVRPWGSWYIGMTSLQRTRVGKNFFIETGLGVSMYNFKFQQDNINIEKDSETVLFNIDANTDNDYIKSKLRVTYLNFSLVPVLDFGDHNRKHRLWDGYGSEFRIGVGPYVGYKIGSKSKVVYDTPANNRVKEKDRDSFYLNNLRYGARLQLGFRSTDFFFNYDFNELFAADKGPKLNAFSFGVIF